MKIFEIYNEIILYSLIAFLVVFILTPFVGKIAKWANVVDLPASLRSRTDRSKAQRMHTKPKFRLGGLGIIFALILISIVTKNTSTQIYAVFIGTSILTFAGILDDKYELSPKYQLSFQFIAAICAVIGGVTIKEINLGGIDINLVPVQIEIFSSSVLTYIFSFPGDLITVIWILTLINAVNWMCGLDALGESITFITALAIGLIGIETGRAEVAFVAFIFASSIGGFVPYNFPPSKMMSGSIGDINFGYLLSSLSILSNAKLTTSLLLLIIPLSDMTYVLIRRIREHKVINPIRLMSISGRIHLHHRFLNLGFSKKQTLYTEISFFAIFALIALYFEKVGTGVIYIHIVLLGLFIIFIISNFLNVRRMKKIQLESLNQRHKLTQDVAPEEKYKY